MNWRGKFSCFMLGFLCLTSIFPNLFASNSVYELNQNDEVIVYALPFDLNYYSAYTSDSYATQQWVGAVYGSLIKRSSANNRGWVSDLAKSLPSVSVDGLTFTFELKENLTSSNGKPITSEDIEFSLNVALSSEINKVGFAKYDGIIDSNSYTEISDLSFSITFYQQFAFPYSILSFPIIPRETYEQKYQNCLSGVTGDCYWNDDQGLDAISTGPFKITNIDSINNIITLEANPYYYDALNLKTDKLIFKTIYGKNNVISQFNQGLVHIMDRWYMFGLSELSNINEVTEAFVGNPASEEIAINHKHPYFGTGEMIPNSNGQSSTVQLENARLLRQAISNTLDRSSYVTEIMDGLAQPAATTFPSAALGWNPGLEPDSFDIISAKTIMESLGFDYAHLGTPDGFGLYSVHFFYITILSPISNPVIDQWSSDIALQLQKIGIGVTQHVLTGWADIIPRTIGSSIDPPLYDDGGYDIFFNSYSWQLDWDPMSIFNGLGSCTTGTCKNFYNFDLDEKKTPLAQSIRDYLSELDFDMRLEKAANIQDVLDFWKPSIAILYPQSHWGWSSDVSGIDSLLISVARQEWDQVYRTGFTLNTNFESDTSSSSNVNSINSNSQMPSSNNDGPSDPTSENSAPPLPLPLTIFWPLISTFVLLIIIRRTTFQ